MERKNLLFARVFFFGIIVFALTACDLFTGIPEEDLMDRIDRDIEWTNAKKLNIRIAYPQEWGFSPQVTGFGDVRVGFPFNVTFTPNPEYALLEWRAYETESLLNEENEEEWLDNPERYLGRPDKFLSPNDIARKKKQLTEGIELPLQVSESGGTINITVTTTKSITLVPFSRAQPRIIRTTPNNGQSHFARGNDISINFAAPLHNESFGGYSSNLIRIFRQQTDIQEGEVVFIGDRIPIDGFDISTGTFNVNDLGRRYELPESRDGSRSIGVRPKEYTDENDQIFKGPESNSEITLEMYSGIKTESGHSWLQLYGLDSNAPITTLTWRIRHSLCRVDTWSAVYQDGTIELEWEQVRADSARIRVVRTSFPELPDIIEDIDNPSSLNINRISIPNVTANERFDISIDLTSDGEPFPMEDNILIWAVNGMAVNRNHPAIAITQDNFYNPWRLDPNQIYVLDESIDVGFTNWSPVGHSSENAFMGTFYGLDNTITFGSGQFTTTKYTGFFGYVDGAKIRDLNVRYTGGRQNAYNTDDIYFGGLVGYATGNTVISNSSALFPANSAFTFSTAPTSQNVYIGGLVGHADNNVVIEYSTSNLVINSTSSGHVYAGGLAGQLDGTIRNSFANGNVNVDSSGNNSKHAGGLVGVLGGNIVDSYATGNILIAGGTLIRDAGGLAGSVLDGTINRSFAHGNVTISGAGGANAGGIAGAAQGNFNISNTAMLGANVIVPADESGNVNRILGSRDGGALSNNHSRGITTLTPYRAPVSAQNGLDGQDVTTTRTSVASFWTSDMTFSNANWRFENLMDGARVGHPVLAGMINQPVAYVEIVGRNVDRIITPSGAGTVDGPVSPEPSEDVSYTAIPSAGYKVSKIMVMENGGENRVILPEETIPETSFGPIPFTFKMPNFDVVITVEFSKITHIVSIGINPGGSGTISTTVPDGVLDGPGTVNVVLDDEISIRATPITGYYVQSIKMTASSSAVPLDFALTGGTPQNGIYFGPRTGTYRMGDFEHGTTFTVTVQFELIIHKFTPQITGSGQTTTTVNTTVFNNGTEVSAQFRDSVAVEAIPTTGWRVASIKAFGGTHEMNVVMSGGSPRQPSDGHLYGTRTGTFEMLDFDYNIQIRVEVTFVRISHRINTSISHPQGGSITSITVGGSPSPSTNYFDAEINDQIVITVTPEINPGQRIYWRIKDIQTTHNSGMIGVPSQSIDGNGVGTYTFTMGGFIFDTNIAVNVVLERLYVLTAVKAAPPDEGSTVIGGSVTTTTQITNPNRAPAGESVTIKAFAELGYEVLLANAVFTGMTAPSRTTEVIERKNVYTYTFNMPESNVEANFEFTKINYGITIDNLTGNGSIDSVKIGDANPVSYNGTLYANYEQDIIFTITANTGYREKVDGTPVPQKQDIEHTSQYTASYKFTMPPNDVTMNVEFELIPTNIRMNPENGITLDGRGYFTVNPANGASRTVITIQGYPNTGYEIGDRNNVTVNPAPHNSGPLTLVNANRLTFTRTNDATTVHTVTVSFRGIQSNLAGHGTNGTIQFRNQADAAIPNARTGDRVTVRATANAGYEVLPGGVTVELNGIEQVVPLNITGPTVDGNVHTFQFTMPFVGNMPTPATVNVNVAFTPRTFQVTSKGSPDKSETSGNEWFTITDEGNTVINEAPTDSFVFVRLRNDRASAAGYENGSVSVNNGAVATTSMGDGILRFTMPPGPVNVDVTFAPKEHVVTRINVPDKGAAWFTVTSPARTDQEITITINGTTAEAAGYHNGRVTAVYKTGDDQTVTDWNTGDTRFIMPPEPVTVEVTFDAMSFGVAKASVPSNIGVPWFTVATAQGTPITEAPTDSDVVITINNAAANAAGYNYTGTHSVSGVITTPSGENSVTFKMPPNAVTVQVTFEALKYNITKTSVPENIGVPWFSVLPDAATDSDVTITINAPAQTPGYQNGRVTAVYRTGDTGKSSVGGWTANNTTFKMPPHEVTVEVTFDAIQYNITKESLPVGTSADWFTVGLTASPGTPITTATVGQPITITINGTTAQAAGYQNGRVTAVYRTGDAGKTLVGGWTSGTNFTMPTEHVTVDVTFDAIPYNITKESLPVGTSADWFTVGLTASPDNQISTATVGQPVTITINSTTAQAAGYQNGRVTAVYRTGDAGKTSVGGWTSGTNFTMPTEHVTVDVTFDAIPYNITKESLPVGTSADWFTVGLTASPGAPITTATVGQPITITINGTTAQAAGYQNGRVTAVYRTGDTGKTSVGGWTSGTNFTMPTEHVTVEVTFDAIQYNITKESLPVGTSADWFTVGLTASPGTPITTATVGQPVTITISDPVDTPGFENGRVTAVFSTDDTGKTSVGGWTSNNTTFNMPTTHVTVEVTFDAIPDEPDDPDGSSQAFIPSGRQISASASNAFSSFIFGDNSSLSPDTASRMSSNRRTSPSKSNVPPPVAALLSGRSVTSASSAPQARLPASAASSIDVPVTPSERPAPAPASVIPSTDVSAIPQERSALASVMQSTDISATSQERSAMLSVTSSIDDQVSSTVRRIFELEVVSENNILDDVIPVETTEQETEDTAIMAANNIPVPVDQPSQSARMPSQLAIISGTVKLNKRRPMNADSLFDSDQEAENE